MRRAVVLYLFGVTLLTLAGFFSPFWYLGFVPLGAGAVWAAYDLIDVGEAQRGDTATAPPR